eukprot:3013455-Rhodomonas_salina.4
MYSRSIHRESERQTVDERGYEAGLGTSMGCLIWKEKEGEEQGMDFRLVTYGPTCVLTATEVVTRGYGLQDGVWQHEVSFRLGWKVLPQLQGSILRIVLRVCYAMSVTDLALLYAFAMPCPVLT